MAHFPIDEDVFDSIADKLFELNEGWEPDFSDNETTVSIIRLSGTEEFYYTVFIKTDFIETRERHQLVRLLADGGMSASTILTTESIHTARADGVYSYIEALNLFGIALRTNISDTAIIAIDTLTGDLLHNQHFVGDLNNNNLLANLQATLATTHQIRDKIKTASLGQAVFLY
jgi:hypothetical protein